MKFKKIMLMTFLLLAVLTISSVSATDNLTDVTEGVLQENPSDDIDLNYMGDEVSPSSSDDGDLDDVKLDESPENGLISSSQNDNLKVDNDTKLFGALQNQINGAASGSTIELDADYVSDDPSGSAVIMIDKELTINGNGHTLNAYSASGILTITGSNVLIYNLTFIHGSNKYGGAVYNCGENNTLDSCVFIGCEGTKSYGYYTHDSFGGAISNEYTGANFNINSCTFRDCSSYNAGAIYNSAPDCTISSCIFINCSSENQGGAISNDGNCIINSSSFLHCSCGSKGGAIFNANVTDVYSCSFMNCSAFSGNALYNQRGKTKAIGCSFLDLDEGAVYSGDVEFINCTFKNQSGGDDPTDDGTFAALKKMIDDADVGSTVDLDKDYACEDAFNYYSIIIDKALTINGNGHTIDGSSIASAFEITGNNVNIKNITFINCYTPYQGGALNVGGDNCNITSCRFINCSAEIGGAIYSYYTTNFNANFCEFVNCSIFGDGSTGYGDAIFHESWSSPCTITSCVFRKAQNSSRYVIQSMYVQSNANKCTFVDLDQSSINGFKLTDCSFKTSDERGTFTELQELINDAVEGSTIILIDDYIYDNGFGIGGINIAKALTIDGNGHTIDGKNAARIFNVAADSNVEFVNIIFKNGYATNGGAINGNCAAVNCSFIGNSAKNGGAIYGTTTTAVNCSFIGNSANNYGGATFGNCTAVNCNFENNSVNQPTSFMAGMGGAMYAGISGSAVEVGCYAVNCTFINNAAAAQGGALFGGFARNCTFWYNQAGSVGGALVGNAYDCVFTENSADYSGGAVYSGFLFEDTYVVNCTFRNNSARFGGAVSDCIVINSIFIDNYATDSGGAISQGSAENCTFRSNSAASGGAIASASALNCTFIGNHASEGGAMDANGYTAVNCLFADNFATNGGATHYVAVYNCRFTNNSATASGGAMYAGVCADSNFAQNHAGMNGGAVCDAVVSNSLFDHNSAVNGGAMTGGKVADSIFSNNVATAYGGAVYHAEVSTSNQFNNNVAPNGNDTYDEVWFDKRNAKTFYDLNSLINANNGSDVYLNDDYIFDPHYDFDFIGGVVISRVVTVHGNSHSIDGYDVTRMFRVTNSGAVFMDIDFVNGKVTYFEGGGAIKGNSTAVNCNFVNNSAISQYSNGGALDECNAIGCTFINNHAGANAGAISFANAYNCTFINNDADATGGAIYQGRATNCNFTDNSAVDAGAIYGTAENCIFTGNRATRYGGAMYLGSAYDCIFIGNFDQYGNDTYNTHIYKSSFSASNFTSAYKSGAKLSVNLVSASGEQITNAKITVKVYKNDALIGNYSFSSGAGWTVNLDAGDYKAVLSVENQGYAVDPVNVTLKISQASTTLSASAVTATYNVNKNLVVTLKDAKGVLANKKVTVKVGTISKTLTTNSKGQVSVDVSTLSPKAYSASIKFAGDSNFKTSSKSIKVTVKKATPKVVASAKAFKLADKTKKYVVTFKTNTNKPLKGVTVYIKVNGITYSAKTSSNGQATFKLTKLKKVGSFSAAITFKGNTYYNKLSKTVKITVKK